MKPQESVGDLTNLIKNIRSLSNFIYDAYLLTEDGKYAMLCSDFRLFHHIIKMLYKEWFPKSKKCTDADIINNIYQHNLQKKDWHIWVKYSMACLINSSERVFNRIENIQKLKNIQGFKGELNLLYDIAFETPIFLQVAFKIMENRTVDFGHARRPYITAREAFNVSQQILTKFTYPNSTGGFALSPSSVMLLRQSIELWLWEVFGIEAATDENNKIIKLNPEKLFELLDNKGLNVKLPVSKSVIMNIHKWTQPYVHAGWMKYTWEIEHAQNTLSPIFNLWEIDIKESYYNNVEGFVRKITGNSKLKLQREKKPSCNLIK